MTTAAPDAPALSHLPDPAPSGKIQRVPNWLWGTILVVVVLGLVVLIFASFEGTFTQFSTVTVQLPESSTAVALNSPVEYRDVTVGKVASQGRSVPGGLVSVVIHIKPGDLDKIPAGVKATVTPVSFFGNEYVVLEPPNQPGSATLQPGQLIPPLSTGETASLQATLGDLDTLIKEINPQKLNAALTAIAGSLQGQGTSLGKNLVTSDTYLKEMLPLWPTFVENLQTLVPIANSLQAATPNLVQIFANQTVTSNTVTELTTNVEASLSGSATFVADFSQLLDDVQQPFELLADDSGPFLQDLSQNPQEISQLLGGLDTWAKSWLAAEDAGPYLSLTATIPVQNPADLGLAVLGGSNVTTDLLDGLGPSYVNPATYTSADCPHFGALSGCGGVTTGLTPQPTTYSVPAIASSASTVATPVLPEPAQTRTVGQIVTALTGSRPSDSSISTLLLSPVLSDMVRIP
jgi:phospholipid/cholesterol/gamma-HCH transport system substrate-binding protein